MSDQSAFVISPGWLQQRLGQPGLAIVDGSWYLPAQKRNASEEYASGHIPGAVFFDQDRIVDPASKLPHAFPPPELFADHVGAMGISAEDTIVVYDGPGFFSAPRLWWLFKTMGAPGVFLLDGGLDRWRQQGRPLSTERPDPKPVKFAVRPDLNSVAGLNDMRSIVRLGTKQIADARPAGRFAGTEPEPRKGVASGHMPGARNLPAHKLSRDGSLLPLSELRSVFESAGIDLSRPVVTSCGSGVTAAAITLALQSMGHTDNQLYDGSWSEWGSLDDTPIETGQS